MALVDGHTAAVQFGFPFVLGLLQLGLELLLLVTVTCCALKVLGLYRLELVLLGFGDALLQVFNLLGGIHLGDMHARSRLVHGVDGLVGEEAVADVAVGKGHAGLEGLVGIVHAVVLLVHRLDVVQDFQRLFGRGGLDQHLLETAF